MGDNDGATAFRRGKTMACPHCGGGVSVSFNVELMGDLLPFNPTAPTPIAASQAVTRIDNRTEEEREALERAERLGLIQAFREAQYGGRPPEQLPKDMGALFLLFFRKATLKRIPERILRHYINEFGGAQIEVYGAEGVAVVLADKQIKAFVPYKLIGGANAKTIGGGTGARVGVDFSAFDAWIRTRHGYVPSSTPGFFNAMRQHSRGEFARLVQ